MPTIDAFCDEVAPLSPETVCADVYARFDADPQALVLAVVENGSTLGIVERDPFLRKMAAESGRSLYGGRPISILMDMEPVVVDATTESETLMRTLMAQPGASALRGFVVARHGRYHGVGTLLGLMQVSLAAGPGHAASVADSLVAPEPAPNAPTSAENEIAVARRNFAAFISRELRPSMTGMGAVADLLKRQPLSPDAQAYVQTISDSAESTLRLLDDALDLTRAQAGDLALTPTTVQLGTFMDELQTRWSPRASRDGVQLMIGYQGDTELAAQIDEGRLRQIFDRLIGAAFRGARKGVVEASLKAWSEGDIVHIAARVFDNGRTLEPDQLADIFSVQEQDCAKSDGLGLPVCRLVIEAMGGTIRAESNAGRGANFLFSVDAPRVIVAAEVEPQSNLTTLPDAGGLTTKPHILIVDDNATNRVVAQALCEMFGCTSAQVEDGVEALEAVQSGRFDLILMDIKMPRMDGVQATAAIRSLPGPVAATPIVALTANADPADARGYIAMGMAAVVEKPIKPERLMQAMNMALGAGAEGAKSAQRRSHRAA